MGGKMKRLIIAITLGILLGLALNTPSAKAVFAASSPPTHYQPGIVIYTMPQLEELVGPKTWLEAKITSLIVSTNGLWGYADGRNLTAGAAFKESLRENKIKDDDYTILKVFMTPDPSKGNWFTFWFIYIESSKLK